MSAAVLLHMASVPDLIWFWVVVGYFFTFIYLAQLGIKRVLRKWRSKQEKYENW